jgi:hypothetical protein
MTTSRIVLVAALLSTALVAGAGATTAPSARPAGAPPSTETPATPPSAPPAPTDPPSTEPVTTPPLSPPTDATPTTTAADVETTTGELATTTTAAATSTTAPATTSTTAPATTSTTSTSPSTPAVDIFAIGLGDIVSDGVPAAGAGNIEVGGTEDVYTFGASGGDEVILDVLAGNNTTFRWRLDAPDGSVVFDGIYGDRVFAADAGTYTVTVRGATATATGSYSFRVVLTPLPQPFGIAVGDTVSDGVPAAGAGNIEQPGARDVYSFDGAAGQAVIFDHLAGRNTSIRWSLHAPGGSELFDTFIGDRQLDLPATGVYTITLSGLNIDSGGTYSFRLIHAAAAQQFTIALGDTVSDGVPEPGAGNLDAPGSVDVYHFDATAGQQANIDVLSGSTNDFRWSLAAPDGSFVFDGLYVDQQPTLTQAGTYTLTVEGLQLTDTGTYSFGLFESPRIDEFTIAVGDTVADGVPGTGAGNLEAPGASDVYRFDATAGQTLDFEVLAGETFDFSWQLRAPSGSSLFYLYLFNARSTLPETGTYTLTVKGGDSDKTGAYSFRLVELVPPVDEFTIAFGDTVTIGDPGPGAGSLEFAGAVDRYRFDAVAGQPAVLDVLAGDAAELAWVLTAPSGATLVDAAFVDRELTFAETGTHTLSVAGAQLLSTGTYSFQLFEPPQTQDFTIAFGDRVSDGVPEAGAGRLEVPGSIDRYHFDATAGTVAGFVGLTGLPEDLRWILAAPDGTTVFDERFGSREETLHQTGTYTLTVMAQPVATIPFVGSYSFNLVDTDVDEFTIAFGDTVSDGVPAAGAGNIEVDHGTDRYLFDATAGDVAVFDVHAGDRRLSWELIDPNGDLYFSGGFGDDRQPLDAAGTYTLTIDTPAAQTYSFSLLLAPPADRFEIAIGDTVSDGAPAPGAGNLEKPGSSDLYTFAGRAGQVVTFDVISGDHFSWSLTGPGGRDVPIVFGLRGPTRARPELFAEVLRDVIVTLPADGTYTLALFGEGTATGTYSFRSFDRPPTDEFTIAFGDTVADGVPGPGAGNIEVAGAVDRYHFDAAAATVALVTLAPGPLVAILSAPDGTLVPRQRAGYPLDQAGTYTLAVQGGGLSTGMYTFTLVDRTELIDEFTIAFGDTVSDGVPATGAGNVEQPYGLDRYHFDAVAGQVALFEAIDGAPDELHWWLLAPDGSEVFLDDFASSRANLTQAGTHTLIVGGGPAAYSFRLSTEPLRVDVDVLPPCIRDHGFGLTLVVIFGSGSVDVDDLDLRTVELEGVPLWTLFGRPVTLEVDANRDGHRDVGGLIVDLAGAIPAQATSVTLTAVLDDGTPIEGSHTICRLHRRGSR